MGAGQLPRDPDHLLGTDCKGGRQTQRPRVAVDHPLGGKSLDSFDRESAPISYCHLRGCEFPAYQKEVLVPSSAQSEVGVTGSRATLL